jgi:uncharacterized protein YmfQ (DUF2313 family)
MTDGPLNEWPAYANPNNAPGQFAGPRDQDAYAEALKGALPQGQAWKRRVDLEAQKTMFGLAGIYAYADMRAQNLAVTESDPRQTREMLGDWERNFGLPDPCARETTTVEERRTALVLRMTMLGTPSRAFFIDVAAQLGYTITITEYSPYQCGISRCGDTRALNPDTPDKCRWELGPGEMRYYWTIHVNATRISHCRCGVGQTGITRLLSIGLATDLECMLRRLKPGHTEIVFDYSPAYSMDFTAPQNSQYLLLFAGVL